MKKLLPIFFLLFSYTTSIHAQALSINTTRFVGGDSSCGWSVAQYSIPTKDGGVLFVGSTDCYAGGGNIPPNFADAAGADNGNVLIGKLDSNLDVTWVKVYGGTQYDAATSAVQTLDGGYAVLAYTQSHDIDVSGNHGTGDLWLIRLDSLGNLLWQKCYGSIYDEQPGSIALTPDNGFIMFGISNGAGGDVPTHYSGSQFDYDWFVVKTDSLGNKQWAKSIGGLGDEESYGSILAVNNAYYLVSSSNSTDYDCTDTAWCAGNGHGTEYNYYMFKLDTAGNKLWDSSYGGPGGDVVYSAVWDSRDSSIVMNGLTTQNGYMVTGFHDLQDIWVIKTDKDGVLKWETCLGGPYYNMGQGIACTPYGYLISGYVNTVGHSINWIFALDILGDTLTSLQFGGPVYEEAQSVNPFRQGFAVVGTTASSGFTEGINIGHQPGLMDDAYISYINYWPLKVANVNVCSQHLSVYPNPTNKNTRIEIPNENGTIFIISCVGECIYYIKTQQQEFIDINTANFGKGLYIVKWQGEDGLVLTKKLIKN